MEPDNRSLLIPMMIAMSSRQGIDISHVVLLMMYLSAERSNAEFKHDISVATSLMKADAKKNFEEMYQKVLDNKKVK